MDVLVAMDRMAKTLVAEQAPARQVAGVRVWRSNIAAAVAAGKAAGAADAGTPSQALLNQRFVCGNPTHRAWLGMCQVIIGQLDGQLDEAIGLVTKYNRRAAAADTDAKRSAALRKARLAANWRDLAGTAAANGRELTNREDKIMRPVGFAIAAAGGLTEVAQDKHYHQRGGSSR